MAIDKHSGPAIRFTGKITETSLGVDIKKLRETAAAAEAELFASEKIVDGEKVLEVRPEAPQAHYIFESPSAG